MASISYALKIIGVTAFVFIDDPNPAVLITVFAIMNIGQGGCYLSMDSTFSKNLKKDVRGILNGTQALFGYAG